MRLWTLHPQYLDAPGLVAAWREALLAQKVLAGLTKGYRQHPQLIRFREQSNPTAAIASFLAGLADEAERRGYRFDVSKIATERFAGQISETDGQLLHEWNHLRMKLEVRAPHLAIRIQSVRSPEPHPLFKIIRGSVRDWEKRSGLNPPL
jgi:hypothetical protein